MKVFMILFISFLFFQNKLKKMNRNLNEIGTALIAWINTLDYPNKTRVDDVSELYDGVIITELMSKMYFSFNFFQ